MSESKHTPGPWQAIRSVTGKLYVVGPKHDGRSTSSDRVAKVPYRRGQGPHNVAVIAAAPIGLELAKAALAYNANEADSYAAIVEIARRFMETAEPKEER